MESHITLVYDQALKDKVNQMRTMTGNMEERNEDTVSEEQDKIRETLGTTKKPDCFAYFMAMIGHDGTKTSWADYNPIEYQDGENTQKIFNTYEINQYVSKTDRLKCACGQSIGRDTSLFYHNPKVSPAYLLIGMDCALKYKLVSPERAKQLRKEKREQKKQQEEKRIQKWKNYTRMLKKYKREYDRIPIKKWYNYNQQLKFRKWEHDQIQIQKMRECRPYCKYCGDFYRSVGDSCRMKGEDELCVWI